MIEVRPYKIVCDPKAPVVFTDTKSGLLSQPCNIDVLMRVIYQNDKVTRLENIDIAIILYVIDTSFYAFEDAQITKSLICNNIKILEGGLVKLRLENIRFMFKGSFENPNHLSILRLKVRTYHNQIVEGERRRYIKRSKRVEWKIKKINVA